MLREISDAIGHIHRADWLLVGDAREGQQTERGYDSLSEASDEDGESEDEDLSESDESDEEPWRYTGEDDEAEHYAFAELAAGGGCDDALGLYAAEEEDEEEDYQFGALPGGGGCDVSMFL